MTIGLERSLNRMFNNSDNLRSNILLNDSDFNLYIYYLEIDISNKSDILCPLYCFNAIKQGLYSNHDNTNFTKLIIPIISNKYNTSHKSIDSLVANVLKGNSAFNLYEVTFKGETFFIGKHLILSKDFNPLYMTCIKYDSITDNIKDYNLLVNKSLFTSSNTIIEKFIMKKMIPYCMNIPLSRDYFTHDKFKYPSIVFTEDISFIKSALKSTTIAAEPYDILDNELDNLYDSINYIC